MARDDETRRMREAAELALDQIDWCVSYLRSIRKTEIAAALAKNRAEIIRRLREEDERDRQPGRRVRG